MGQDIDTAQHAAHIAARENALMLVPAAVAGVKITAEGLIALSALMGVTVVALQQMIQDGTLARMIGSFATAPEVDLGEARPEGAPLLMSPTPEHLRPPHILITPIPEPQGPNILSTPRPEPQGIDVESIPIAEPLPPLPGFGEGLEQFRPLFQPHTCAPPEEGFKLPLVLAHALPEGVPEGRILALEDTSKTTEKQVEVHDIGSYGDLSDRSVKGDELEIHHVPQKHPAKQVVSGYDEKTAPSIVLPKKEHRVIPNIRGKYTESSRDLLARDVRNLREHTKTPNSKIQELVKKVKETYPKDMKKGES